MLARCSIDSSGDLSPFWSFGLDEQHFINLFRPEWILSSWGLCSVALSPSCSLSSSLTCVLPHPLTPLQPWDLVTALAPSHVVDLTLAVLASACKRTSSLCPLPFKALNYHVGSLAFLLDRSSGEKDRPSRTWQGKSPASSGSQLPPSLAVIPNKIPVPCVRYPGCSSPNCP